jgi:hypothetical protein
MFSAPGRRYVRHQMRRWFATNGLTIVVVSTMMVIAWILAER